MAFLAEKVSNMNNDTTTAKQILASIAVILLYILYRVVRSRLENKEPFPGVFPMAPRSHWILGHLQLLTRGDGDFRKGYSFLMVDNANNHGQSSFWRFNQRIVSVNHFQDVRNVLQSSEDRRQQQHVQVQSPLCMGGRHSRKFVGRYNLAIMFGKEWKCHRKINERAFKTAVVEGYRRDVVKVTKNLLKSLLLELRYYNKDEDKDENNNTTCFDFLEGMQMVTMDVFGRTFLSCDFGCCKHLQLSPIASAFQFLSEDVRRRLYHHPLNLANSIYAIPTAANRRFKRESTLLRSSLERIIRKRQKEMKKQGNKNTKKTDLLAYLLDAEKKLYLFTDEAISDTLVALMFAGFDTLSVSLTYAMYLICRNPLVKQQCVEEIASVSEENARNPDSFRYCHAVFMETLRLYPPMPSTSRTVTKDITLVGGKILPKDTYVMIPTWNIQRNPYHFPKPLEFVPERWVKQQQNDEDGGVCWTERTQDDLSTHEIPPAKQEAFFAFSAGARSCLGQTFALEAGVLVLTTLLRELDFQLSPSDYQVEPVSSFLVQKPRHRLFVKVSAAPTVSGSCEQDASSAGTS